MTHEIRHGWTQGDVGVAREHHEIDDRNEIVAGRTFEAGTVVQLDEVLKPSPAVLKEGPPCGLFTILIGQATETGEAMWRWDIAGPAVYVEELRCIRRIDKPEIASYLTLIIKSPRSK